MHVSISDVCVCVSVIIVHVGTFSQQNFSPLTFCWCRTSDKNKMTLRLFCLNLYICMLKCFAHLSFDTEPMRPPRRLSPKKKALFVVCLYVCVCVCVCVCVWLIWDGTKNLDVSLQSYMYSTCS